MRTCDYRGFLIEPILALLEHIFDSKLCDLKQNFLMCDISAGSADINEKKLRKVVY